MDGIILIWSEGILRPMINGLVVLYAILFHNFGLAIIAFTALVRLIILPLTLKQTFQMKAMSALQPKLQELRTKYPNNAKKVSEETLRLYRQGGISPIGCLGPLIIQFPIWIGLFQALSKTLPTNPDSLLGLSQRLYSWTPFVHTSVPLNSLFFGMELSEPDPTRLLLPVLVGASTWVQQKMSTPPSVDPRQASTNTMMLWMMPIMLAFLTLGFPSGLALYWIVSNIIGVVIQYFITGWGPLFSKAATPVPAPAAAAAAPPVKERSKDGEPAESRSVRQNRRRGHRSGLAGAKRRPGRGGSRGIKPR